MATFKRLKSGAHQAQVAKNGVRKAKSFRLLSEAKDWAARQEHLIATGAPTEKRTVGEAFDRYAREVSPTKRGARWEIIRLEKLAKDSLAEIKLSDLEPSDIASWRDRQLKVLKSSSVSREMQIISHCLSVARREWGWIAANPASEVRRPAKVPNRERRVSNEEIELLAFVANLEPEGAPETLTARAILAFTFAIETAMRAGEICGLRWEDLNGKVARLPMTKNGQAREVPLSAEARTMLERLRPLGDDRCFGMTTSQLDVHFRKSRDKAAIDGLTFHDSRHEAITRLSMKLEILPLARMVGHRDIRMMLVYYNESAADIAERLDG